MDVSTLGATNDFPEELRREVTECSVLLVIMGRTWLTAKSARGLGLGDQSDFVTAEIALALQLKKIVIPVLIDGALLPQETELPPVLKALAFFDAIPLDHLKFEQDSQSLIDVLSTIVPPMKLWLERWRAVDKNGSRENLIKFLRASPPREIGQIAYYRLEGIDWQTALASPTMETFDAFLKQHPRGAHAREALAKRDKLREEQWQKAEHKKRLRQEREEKRQLEIRTRQRRRLRVLTVFAVIGGLILGSNGLYQWADTPGSLLWWQITGGLVQSIRPEWNQRGLALLPDKNLVSISSGREHFAVLDVLTGNKVREFAEPKGGIFSTVYQMAFSKDGQILATGGGGYYKKAEADGSRTNVLKGELRIYDFSSGAMLKTLVGPESSLIIATAISSSGQMAITGGSAEVSRNGKSQSLGQLIFWNLQDGKEIRALTPHGDSIASVGFSADGRLALSVSKDDVLKLWDVSTGRELRSIALKQKSESEARPAVFSADGNIVLTGGYRQLKLWSVATGEELREFSGHTGDVLAVAFSPDGRYILSGGVDGLRLWELATGKLLHLFPGSNSSRVAFTPDGNFALSIGSRTINKWMLAPWLDIPSQETGNITAAPLYRLLIPLILINSQG